MLRKQRQTIPIHPKSLTMILPLAGAKEIATVRTKVLERVAKELAKAQEKVRDLVTGVGPTLPGESGTPLTTGTKMAGMVKAMEKALSQVT